MGRKHAGEKIVLNFYFPWAVNSNKYAVLTTLSSTLLRTKKKTVKKFEIWVKFFTIGCVFYRVGDWDDLQTVNSISISGILTPSHLLGQKVKPRWLPMEGRFVRQFLSSTQAVQQFQSFTRL